MKGWQNYGFPQIELRSFDEVDYALNYAYHERYHLRHHIDEYAEEKLEEITWNTMYDFDILLYYLCGDFCKDTTSYANRWDMESLFQTVSIEGGFSSDEINAIRPGIYNPLVPNKRRRMDVRLASWGRSRMMMLNHLRYVPVQYRHDRVFNFDITYYAGQSDNPYDSGEIDLPLHEVIAFGDDPKTYDFTYYTGGFWRRSSRILKSIKVNIPSFYYDKVKLYINIGNPSLNPEVCEFDVFGSDMQFGLNEYVLDANGTIPLLNAPPVLNSTTYPGREIYYGYRIKEIIYDFYDAFKFG